MTTVEIPAPINATSALVKVALAPSDATSLSISDTQLSQVWNRPEKKIRKRLKRIAKAVRKGEKTKKVNRRVEKFFLWVTKKGMRKEILAQISHNW